MTVLCKWVWLYSGINVHFLTWLLRTVWQRYLIGLHVTFNLSTSWWHFHQNNLRFQRPLGLVECGKLLDSIITKHFCCRVIYREMEAFIFLTGFFFVFLVTHLRFLLNVSAVNWCLPLDKRGCSCNSDHSCKRFLHCPFILPHQTSSEETKQLLFLPHMPTFLLDLTDLKTNCRSFKWVWWQISIQTTLKRMASCSFYHFGHNHQRLQHWD